MAFINQTSVSDLEFPTDYIETTLIVPFRRQMILFDRVTITTTGRLIVYGRSRIL